MHQRTLFKHFLYFICLAVFGLPMTGISQQMTKTTMQEAIRCGTDEAFQQRLLTDPEYAQYFKDFVEETSDKLSLPCDGSNTVTIPVAFHFDDGFSCVDFDCILQETQEQLDFLNAAFADNTMNANIAQCPSAYEDAAGNSIVSNGTCVNFCLAITPDGTEAGIGAGDPPITVGVYNEGGINAGGPGAAGWDGILNIFVLANLCTQTGGLLGVADGIGGQANGDGVTVCGFFFGDDTMNGGCGLADQDIFDSLSGALLVHEIGHYLGLWHTFQNPCADEPASPGGITVMDTPGLSAPTPFICPPAGCFFDATCGNNVGTANFMDYTADPCQGIFTNDQAAVINFVAQALFGATNSVCSSAPDDDITALDLPICPTAVVSAPDLDQTYCDVSTGVFPAVDGLVFDNFCGVTLTWSIDGYLSAGGTAVTAPDVLTSVDCAILTQTYYINAACEADPAAPLIDVGTYTETVYPGPPADLSSLVQANVALDGCEPSLVVIPGCEDFVTVTADPGNAPVVQGATGSADFTIQFAPDPAGPDCCFVPNGEGEENIPNGDFEEGIGDWVEFEDVPGQPPFGIIGVSGGAVNGTNDAWFAGWGFDTYMSITQDIDIWECSEAMLSFDYFAVNCSSLTGVEVNVIIGGITVGTLQCDNALGTFGPIDIMPLGIPTGPTTIVIEGIETNDGSDPAASILIDNVSLVTGNCPIPPSICETTITKVFTCPGDAIPTMGEWGLICLTILMMIFGIVAIRTSQAKKTEMA